MLPLLVALIGCSAGSNGTPPAATPAVALPPGTDPALLDPKAATARAPDEFKVLFDTTKGPFTVDVHRDWAPIGADRFYNLVHIAFYDHVMFFRVLPDFMAQFGISPYPQVNAVWTQASLQDDPVAHKNVRGTISFANAGPNTRSTQVFINMSDGNIQLDAMGFAPFGEVVDGMSVVDALYTGYGEGAPRGKGPDQGRLQNEGEPYLSAQFPLLDGVKTARLLP